MDYHTIQEEKAKAMKRYRRLRNVAKLWRLLEFAVALVLLSWSSTRLPVAVKFACHCVLQLSEYLFNPHINFLIGNAIIVVVVLLSRQNNSGHKSGACSLLEEYVQNTEVAQSIASVDDGVIATSPPSPATEIEKTSFDDKQIIVSENAVTRTECDAVSTAIDRAKKQIQRFQRTQSEKLKRDLRAKPHRQLRRSETAITPGANERAISSFDTVDKLSSEEFQRTIEAFIARQQRFLWAQKMEEMDQ